MGLVPSIKTGTGPVCGAILVEADKQVASVIGVRAGEGNHQFVIRGKRYRAREYRGGVCHARKRLRGDCRDLFYENGEVCLKVCGFCEIECQRRDVGIHQFIQFNKWDDKLAFHALIAIEAVKGHRHIRCRFIFVIENSQRLWLLRILAEDR